jgi:adenylate cyclase
VERKLAAILCADVYGYSRLMGEDEEATLRTLTSHRTLIDSQIEQHHGRFVNSAGDSVLAEFASVVEAVNCAVEIQTGLRVENASLAPERRMEFRIGVNLGDVMVEGEQIYGDGVNVAARLESLAEPGGICISDTAHAQVKNKLAFNYEDRGAQSVKNIAEPVRVYRVLLNGSVAVPQRTPWIPPQYRRRGGLSFAGLTIIVMTVLLVQHLSLKPPRSSASIPPQEKPVLPLPSIPSIAVLPFTNLSGDPQQEYFSDGISDQLINGLSHIPGLFVIARNSSFAYKGKPTKEQEIGKELGVKYVLEGSVLRSLGGVRIGVELVDAGSGTEKWTAHYDQPLRDIFAVQDKIVSKVVTTLGLLFRLDEMKLPHWGNAQPPENLEAYDDYLRAVEIWSLGTKDDSQKARQLFEKAIELDPKYAEAYAYLGWVHLMAAWNQWSANPLADLAQSSELARKALVLEDTNSSALALLSEGDWMQMRFDEAVVDGKRAVTINPNYALGFMALSDALVNDLKSEEALRAAEKAMRLDPNSADAYAYAAGNAYIQLGRYEAAVEILKRTVAAHPNLLVAHIAMVIVYGELGRENDARSEAAEILRISPKFSRASLQGFKNFTAHPHWDDDLRRACLK